MKQDVIILICVTLLFILFMTIIITIHLYDMKELELAKPTTEMAQILKKKSIW